MGVEPEPIPPIYDPSLVAKAITFATEHPKRQMMVGGAGAAMVTLNRVAPKLAESYMRKSGFKSQRSDEAKSSQAPDNLYHHISGHNQIEGEFMPRTKSFSLYSWFDTHPVARVALAGLLVGGAFFLGAKLIESRRKPTLMQRVRKAAPSLRRKPTLQKRLSRMGKRAQKQLPFDEIGSLLESLPLIGLLMTLGKNKSLLDRLPIGNQKSFAHKVQDRLPSVKPEKVLQKVQDRLPEKLPFQKDQSLIDKVQDRLPSRSRDGFVRNTVEKLPFVK